jgi:hypothetical protein
MVKIIEAKKQDCEHLLGQFLDERHYDVLINEDCDVYENYFLYSNNTESNVILKFRKNFFTEEQQRGAYQGLKDAAGKSRNRGIAAGPKGTLAGTLIWLSEEQNALLDYLMDIQQMPSESDISVIKSRSHNCINKKGSVWLKTELEKHEFKWDQWLTKTLKLNNAEEVRKQAKWVLDNLVSDTRYANEVNSGIAGWFGRYPRIPYGRPTAYTFYNKEKFELAYPFFNQLSKGFEELLPNRYGFQMHCANKLDPTFRVPGTPFTTITVNKNFRTAAHRDAGDLSSGFSNLCVITDGDSSKKFDGGYLILPEIRAAVNIRPGDLLLVGNHDWIHGNTPITGDKGFERISIVSYFREDMLELGSREYEDARFDFVESRRKNKDHKEWREFWNGVSENMWESEEWFNFLKSRGQDYLIDKYHGHNSNDNPLSDLFE